MKDQYQIYSKSAGTLGRHNCYSCLVAKTNQSSGDSGCVTPILII